MIKVTLEELLEAGSHFGHQVKRWNPKMAPYIYAAHDGIHVFDLSKTRESLLEACEVLETAAKTGKTILLVGTKRQARDLIENAAKNLEQPYVTSRWLGGLLTNFEQMKKSLRKLEDMKKSRDGGDYDVYTKHERLLIDREIAKLERIFGGVTKLTKLPDLLFIVDTKEEVTAVHEAQKMGIPIVGICDTNADPTVINYPIPANDDAQKSLILIIGLVEKAIATGLGKVAAEAEKSKPKSKKEKVEETSTK